MNPIVFPLLITAGVGGLLLANRSNAPANGGTTPPANGGTTPAPVTPGIPNDPTLLIPMAQQVLAGALLNPGNADPTKIGLLAAALRAQGQNDLATQLEGVGPTVCAARGMPTNCWVVPIKDGTVNAANPNAGTPGGPIQVSVPAPNDRDGQALKAYRDVIESASANIQNQPLDRLQRFAREARAYGYLAEALTLESLAARRAGAGNTEVQTKLLALYEKLKANPGNDLQLIANLGDQLAMAGLPSQAMEMRALFQTLKGGGAVPVNPNAGTLPAALVAQIQDALTNPAADPVKIDTLISTIKMSFPNGFLTQITQLERRAKELRELGR